MVFVLTFAALIMATGLAAEPLAFDEAVDTMPFTRDLRADTGTGKPLVVMFSRSDCGYCRRLEAEQFAPLLRAGSYAERIVVRKLSLDPGQRVLDVDGIQVETREVASRYRVFVTPTVLLLGTDGREIAERLVGLGLADFYWAYLERAIRQAERRLEELGERGVAAPRFREKTSVRSTARG